MREARAMKYNHLGEVERYRSGALRGERNSLPEIARRLRRAASNPLTVHFSLEPKLRLWWRHSSSTTSFAPRSSHVGEGLHDPFEHVLERLGECLVPVQLYHRQNEGAHVRLHLRVKFLYGVIRRWPEII